jgi:hypothetical protein
LAPRHELQTILINYVVFRWLNVGRVYIETNHGSDKGHSDLFLPGLFGPAECDFDLSRLPRYKLEKEFRVLAPSHRVLLLLKFLVV